MPNIPLLNYKETFTVQKFVLYVGLVTELKIREWSVMSSMEHSLIAIMLMA